MKGEGYWRELVSGRRRGVTDRLTVALLVALSLPYAALLRLRARLYAAGLRRTRRLGRPVISVGNLAVGGTGKTPLTAHIARHLQAQGKQVAVLSRGYGGSSSGTPRIVSDGETVYLTPAEAGDEPSLLARQLPGVMVVVGADRYAAGRLAERELAPDVFILDDGFQHLRLHRDLNILLLDCRNPYGNGRTLPAGPLREPVAASARADLVVLTRCEEGSLAVAIPGDVPVLAAGHRLSGIVPLEGGESRPLSALYGERVLAFAGIADPDRFFSGLAEAGIDLSGSLSLPDHAVYNGRTIAGIRQLFRSTGATCLVTTAKDAVKLEQHRKQLGRVWVAQLELVIADPALLEEKVAKLFDSSGETG